MASISAPVAEVGTTPGINFVDSLFQSIPRDERYANVAYTQVNSVTSLDGSDKLIFTINPYDPPIAVDLSDVLIKVQVKLTNDRGTDIQKTKYVYPCNNACLSMFESLGTCAAAGINVNS